MENPNAESNRSCFKFINMTYEVTIGIPVYNVEQYIRESLQSALSQTHPDIEFLICDDCGTDSSLDIIQEIQDIHPRGKDIRVIHQPYNMGVSAARNRIIDEARGRMLYFMDSDDLIEPFTIAKLIEEQKQNDADIVFGSYDKIEVYNDNYVEDIVQYPRSVFLEEEQLAAFAYRKYGGLQASSCNYLVNVELLRNIGLRFIDTDYWEDMAFTNELVTYCRSSVLLPDITYHYMCRYNSLSNYQQRDTIEKEEILRSVKVVDYLKVQSLRLKSKSYYPQRCRMVMMTAFYVLCNILKNSNKISPSFTRKELKHIMNYPASLMEIIRFRQVRTLNLVLFMIGKLPASMMLWVISIVGKWKGLI